MEIHKEEVIKNVYYSYCKKCGKQIKGTSELTLKHNFKVHKAFCDGNKK